MHARGAQLHAVMSQHGPLKRVEIIRDTVTLVSRGFAFVDFVTQTVGDPPPPCLPLLAAATAC
eukprot:COSAG01_NODE_9800_length_2340_cov_5.178046_1_plen_63_part_00